MLSSCCHPSDTMIRRHALRPLSPRHISARCVPILLLLCSSVPAAQTHTPHRTTPHEHERGPCRAAIGAHAVRMARVFPVPSTSRLTMSRLICRGWDLSASHQPTQPPPHHRDSNAPLLLCLLLLLLLSCCCHMGVVLLCLAMPLCPAPSTALLPSRKLVGHSAIFFLFLLVVARDVKCLQWK